MANRLTRDQILIRALQRVDSPTLDQKEQPTPGTYSGTLGSGFLQEALDYWYKCFPIKGVLTTAAVSFSTGNLAVALPADFLIDYQNGILLDNDQGRLIRRGLSTILNESNAMRGKPMRYAIRNEGFAHVRPVPDQNYTGVLYYYKLPAVLTGGDIPPFPDDLVLVKFCILAYKEWLGMLPEGTAMEYARMLVAALQKAGVGAEPEPDQIELDPQYFGENVLGPRDDWMGGTTV